MANDTPNRNPDPSDDGGGSDARNVERWMHTSRYVALVSLFAEQQDGSEGKDQPPRLPLRRRLTAEDRSALLNAGLILLVIAVAAFIGGLL